MKFTPTEKKMLKLLADGLPHTRRELHAILYDDQGALSNIQVHLSRIRRKIKHTGKGIICELSSRRICYRLVHLVRCKVESE